MKNLDFYKETLDKINDIVAQTSAPFAQILMFGGQLPAEEQKTLDEVGKITSVIFEILKNNGYQVKEQGSILSVDLDGKSYYCKKTDTVNKVNAAPAPAPAQPVAPTKQSEAAAKFSAMIDNAVTQQAGPNVQTEDILEKIATPLERPEVKEEPKTMLPPWMKESNPAPAVENSQKESELPPWMKSPAAQPTVEEPKTESELPPWMKSPVTPTVEEKKAESELPPWMKPTAETNNAFDDKSMFMEPPISVENEPAPTEAPAQPVPTNNFNKWWEQVDQSLAEEQKKEEEKKDHVEPETMVISTEKKPENDFYTPGKANFSFKGMGFSNDEEGKHSLFTAKRENVLYDTFELMILPPIETGRKPEPLSVMVAPIEIPTAPAASVPLIASFVFRGKHYTKSSLEHLEKGKNLCVIEIEEYCFLLRGFFDENMKFHSMIATAKRSIDEKIDLKVISRASYGTAERSDEERENGLVFVTNEDRTPLKCNIFPLTGDDSANFVCVTRTLDFIDYHYHAENVHGAQEIIVSINNEKTVIHCKYEDGMMIADAVEII